MDLTRIMTKMVTLSTTVLLAVTAQATSFQALSLKEQIAKRPTTWQAKDNHLTQLSLEELRRMMGSHSQQEDTGVSFAPKSALQMKSDAIIDWRNHNGQNWVSPILDQGNCGSCVAFATVGVLETQMNISRNLSWLNPKFSPQALFACGGGACDMGWFPSAAVNYLQATGIPDEACAPYTMGATGQDVACNSICSDASSRSQKIAGSQTLNGPDAVKAALAYGPVITTLSVYADFVLYSSGIYKHVTGDVLGGHAVSIVGYNDTDRYWIIRNSWAADWGEGGFANVSYDDESGVGNEGWSMSIPNSAGAVAFKNLSDRDYQAGTFTVSAESTFTNTTSLSLQLVGDKGETHGYTCSQAACDFSIESAKIPDGRYQAVVVANAGGVEVARSEQKYFYVMNSTHAATSLSYTGNAVDLSQPLTGRVEFNVNAQSSPVPYTELEFIVTQNGKIFRDHLSRNIAPLTVMGWRTPTVPNGTYQIQLLGKIIVGNQTYTTDGGTYTVTVKN